MPVPRSQRERTLASEVAPARGARGGSVSSSCATDTADKDARRDAESSFTGAGNPHNLHIRRTARRRTSRRAGAA
jgi:hypothetical protein